MCNWLKYKTSPTRTESFHVFLVLPLLGVRVLRHHMPFHGIQAAKLHPALYVAFLLVQQGPAVSPCGVPASKLLSTTPSAPPVSAIKCRT